MNNIKIGSLNNSDDVKEQYKTYWSSDAALEAYGWDAMMYWVCLANWF